MARNRNPACYTLSLPPPCLPQNAVLHSQFLSFHSVPGNNSSQGTRAFPALTVCSTCFSAPFSALPHEGSCLRSASPPTPSSEEHRRCCRLSTISSGPSLSCRLEGTWGSQPWLHIRITQGAVFTILMPGPSPETNSAALRWGPANLMYSQGQKVFTLIEEC